MTNLLCVVVDSWMRRFSEQSNLVYLFSTIFEKFLSCSTQGMLSVLLMCVRLEEIMQKLLFSQVVS
jgi:hypothetical protein